MHITAVLLIAALVQVNAAIYNNEYITLHAKDVAIENVLQSIEKQTGFTFLYDKIDVNKADKVTVRLKAASIGQALEACFKNQPLQYKIIEKTIVIKAKPENFFKTKIPDVSPPPVSVAGKVTDDNGETLPGVSITVKGTSKVSLTDVNGDFKLSVEDENTVLVFSYIGFKPKEVKVGKSTRLTVVMMPDVKALNEVVVVGFGTQTKEEFTGSAARVSGDALKDIPVQSFEQGLAGRAAGVSIGQPNGALNNPPVIRVRGINSISLSSYPLIVVDGIPISTGNQSGNTTVANNPLGDINPADILSIDVLKDAASTSIYGSRAAAGVLLITTKSGKTGKPKVSYEGWTGVSNAARLPDMLNAQQFMDIKNEAVLNAKILGGNADNPAVASALFFPTYKEDGTMVNTNWYDHVYQTGVSQNHSISISGGSESTKYYFSANYSDQNGILKTNEFTRKGARFNLDHKLTSWLNLTANVTYNNTLNASPNTGSLPGNAFGISGSARLAWMTAPNVAGINADGSYNVNGSTMGMGNNLVQSNFYNPLPMLDLNYYTSGNDRIIGNFAAGVKLLKGLDYKMSYAIDRLKIENVSFNHPVTGSGFPAGSASNISRLTDNWNWTNTLTYQKSIAAKHNVSALAGYDVQKFDNSGWGINRTQIADQFFDEIQGSWGANAPTGLNLSERAFASVFSRLTYDFDKKYFLTINFRRDGNSALGTGKKYGNFGGASGGWSLSEEGFYKNSSLSKFVNSVKLRGSWGRVGNGNLSEAYGSQALYISGLYADAPTWLFDQGGNPNLGWETSDQTNIGADLGFLNDRFQLELTYYNNNVNGLILNVPQSLSKGIPGNAILQNVGAMFNKGFEIGINASVINKGKFSYSTNYNITFNKNQVTELFGGSTDEIIGTTATAAEASNITRVGESVGSLYGARTNGVNPETGQRIFINRAGEQVQYSQVVAPGASRWTYLDGTTAAPIGVGDYYLAGNALPKYYGGFNNNFRYANVDLSLNFTFAGGNYIMNGSKGTFRDQRFWNNSTEVFERWTAPGQVTDIPRLVYGDLLSNGSSFPISENVEKGDFIRLQSAALGYRVPAKLFGKSGISSVRVYTQVLNAFLITKYSGLDPEISVNGNSNITPGVDKNSLPQARTFTFGLNVGF